MHTDFIFNCLHTRIISYGLYHTGNRLFSWYTKIQNDINIKTTFTPYQVFKLIKGGETTMNFRTMIIFAVAVAVTFVQNAAAAVNTTLAEFAADIATVSSSVLTLFEAAADFLMQPPFIYFMGVFIMMVGINFIPGLLKKIVGAIKH